MIIYKNKEKKSSIQKNKEHLYKLIHFIGYYLYSFFVKTDNHKIMFFTSRGSYNCNPSFIADELSKNPDYKLIWVCNDTNDVFPDYVRCVKYDSLDFYKEAASSKIWIDNSINTAYKLSRKKKDQIMFQTWHGSIGIKRFDVNPNKRWINRAKKSSKWTNFIISNSSFETELYKKTYWTNTTVLEYGHPRNDIFFSEMIRNSRCQKAIDALNLDSSYKYCLYAPTYRDYKQDYVCDIDFNKLRTSLSEKFGSNWKIIVRSHFLSSQIIDLKNDFLIDASDYSDIQDILPLCDAGITDYSSWICDYVLTRRPGFLYCPDYKLFENERDLLFPLNTTPFPIAYNNNELFFNIMNFNTDKYIQDCNKFLNEKGCRDDGYAAKRVADKIKELI